MRSRFIVLAVTSAASLCSVAAPADQWDSLLSPQQVAACGLNKLTEAERTRLYGIVVAVAMSSNIERAARQYVEDEVGLSDEIDVTSVRGSFLVLATGEVLELDDTSGFSSDSSYLADDASYPSQVLDDDGALQDVNEVYSDLEEALEAQ